MNVPQTAARSLHQSLNGAPWHGPSLRTLLSDVTAEESTRRVFGSHSIVELVLHVAAWIDETASRLEGHAPAAPRAGDWPAVASSDPVEAWERARAALVDAGDRLRSAMERFPEERLDERVGGQPDSVVDGDLTFGAMMIGIAEHNAYHAGQIALSKRAARSRS